MDQGSRRDRVADAVGAGLAYLTFVPVGIVGRTLHEMFKTGASIATTIIPFAGRLHRSLIKWSLHRMRKKSGADAVGFVHEPDGSVELVPVKHKPQQVDEDDVDRAGWHAKGRDQSWHEAADGREVDHLGRTPVVLLDSASTQRATATEARFAECLDLDRTERVVQVPGKSAVEVTVAMGADGANGDAVADGGRAYQILETNIKEAIWQDTLVNIGTDDHDGMRINPRKVKETYREKTGSEQLDEVERLGFLAGLMDDEDRSGFVIKVLLIVLGIIAAVTIGPGLFSSAGGAVSGGGGSLIPILIGLGVI